MKSKIPLLLMEQMVMLLVFALSAALCLQAFVLSNSMSKRSDERDRAVTLVQDIAETVRHNGGAAKAAEILGAEYADGTFSLYYDEDWQPDGTAYVLKVEEMSGHGIVPGLGMARVSVETGGNAEDVLFEVTVAWQEVEPDGT